MGYPRVKRREGFWSCSICGLEVPLDKAHKKFYPVRKNSTGFCSWCKKCSIERSKNWRTKHPDLVKAANKRKYDRDKALGTAYDANYQRRRSRRAYQIAKKLMFSDEDHGCRKIHVLRQAERFAKVMIKNRAQRQKKLRVRGSPR